MITKYKLFENEDNEPKIGDYVLIKKTREYIGDRQDLYNNMEGNIYEIIGPKGSYTGRFKIDYLAGWWVGVPEIEKFSKNKEDLEMYQKEKKYNL